MARVARGTLGTELDQARVAQVLHNTIIETAAATNSFSSIDYRFANTIVDIRNNLIRRITVRDGAQGTASAISGVDLDGTAHNQGPPDIGADEYRP